MGLGTPMKLAHAKAYSHAVLCLTIKHSLHTRHINFSERACVRSGYTRLPRPLTTPIYLWK